MAKINSYATVPSLKVWISQWHSCRASSHSTMKELNQPLTGLYNPKPFLIKVLRRLACAVWKKLQSNGRPISGQDKLLDSSLHQNLNSLFHIMSFELLNIVKLSVVCTVAIILGDKTFVRCSSFLLGVYSLNLIMRQGNSLLDGDFHCEKELGMSIQQWKYCWASLWRQHFFFFFFFCSSCVKVNGSSLSGSKFSSRPHRVWFVGVTPDPSSSALVFFDSLIEMPTGAKKKEKFCRLGGNTLVLFWWKILWCDSAQSGKGSVGLCQLTLNVCLFRSKLF